MASNVQVTFSASIKDLIDATDRVKAALESIKESAERAMEGFKSFAEVFGVAFSTERLVEYIGEMAELGEQTERTASILGVSTKEAQELGFIAKATGGSADALALSMERLQVNLQKAQSGTGPAAAALQALNLRAKDLIGLPLGEQLGRIADAVSKFAGGGNKTAIVMELLGRGGAQMIPILDEGRAGIDRLSDAADRSGAVMSEKTVKALSSVERGLVLMKAAAVGVGGTLVGEFAGAINTVTGGLTELLTDIALLIESNSLWDTAMKNIGLEFEYVAAQALRLLRVMMDVKDLNFLGAVADWNAFAPAIDAATKALSAELGPALARAKAEMKAALGGDEADKRPPPPAMTGLGGGRGQSPAMEQFQTQIKLADEAYKQTQEKLASEVKLHQISFDQQTQLLLGALDKRHEAELAGLAAEAQIGGLSTAQYQKIMDQRKLADQKYAADHQKIMDQAAEKDTQDWENALKPLQSAFDSQLKGLLSGQESFAQASKAIFTQLALDIIKQIESVMVKQAALLLMETVTGTVGAGGGGPSSLLSFLVPHDVGNYNVSAPTAALLHPGEMVISQPFAQGVRDALAGGGSPGAGGAGAGAGATVNFHVYTMDAGSTQSYFQKNGRQIAAVLAPHLNQPSSYNQ